MIYPIHYTLGVEINRNIRGVEHVIAISLSIYWMQLSLNLAHFSLTLLFILIIHDFRGLPFFL